MKLNISDSNSSHIPTLVINPVYAVWCRCCRTCPALSSVSPLKFTWKCWPWTWNLLS